MPVNLELKYENVEDVPDEFKDLYTPDEDGGGATFTAIKNIKTQEDIDRIQAGAVKERNDHKKTKEKLREVTQLWDGMDHQEITEQLAKIEEYKLAAEGKVDEEKMEKIMDARMKSQIRPLEMQIEKLTTEKTELSESNQKYQKTEQRRRIHDEINDANAKSKIGKILDTAIADVHMLGESMLTFNEDGKIVTKDNVGVTPDVPVDIWLTEMAEKRPHWYPPSQGGGANGGQGGLSMPRNPWSKTHWNETEQNRYELEHGRDKAEKMAKSAGSSLGSMHPPQ